MVCFKRTHVLTHITRNIMDEVILVAFIPVSHEDIIFFYFSDNQFHPKDLIIYNENYVRPLLDHVKVHNHSYMCNFAKLLIFLAGDLDP